MHKRSFALFCALLRPFALFCGHLRLRSFADICTLLRSFACFCERPRLERPRLGTPEKHDTGLFGNLLAFKLSPPPAVVNQSRAKGGAPINSNLSQQIFGEHPNPANTRKRQPSLHQNILHPSKINSGRNFPRNGRGAKHHVGPATTQNLVVKLDGEICGGVLVENVSDDFPQQKKLEKLLPNFAGSSPPISPKTPPNSLWKSLVLTNGELGVQRPQGSQNNHYRTREIWRTKNR